MSRRRINLFLSTAKKYGLISGVISPPEFKILKSLINEFFKRLSEPKRKISDRGFSLLKRNLSFYEKANTDQIPIVIGYESETYTTGYPVNKGDIISEATAIKCLKYDIRPYEEFICNHIKDYDKIPQNLFDYLVIFVYLNGFFKFKHSEIKKLVNDDFNNDEIYNLLKLDFEDKTITL